MWRGPPLADFAHESFAQAGDRAVGGITAGRAGGADRRRASAGRARTAGRGARGARSRASLARALHRSADARAVPIGAPGRRAGELSHRATACWSRSLGSSPVANFRSSNERSWPKTRRSSRSARGPARRQPAIAARRRPRGGVLIVAGGALLLATLIAVAVTLAGSGASTVRVAPNSLAAIDTHSDRVTGAVPVGARPGAVAFGSGSVWVANLDDQTVSRVDPTTLRTLRTITVVGPPTGIAAGADGVWVVESNLDPGLATSSVLVGRVDPEFDALGPRVRIGNVVPDGPGAIAAQGNSVWVAPSTGLLTRLDATTGKAARATRSQRQPGRDRARRRGDLAHRRRGQQRGPGRPERTGRRRSRLATRRPGSRLAGAACGSSIRSTTRSFGSTRARDR